MKINLVFPKGIRSGLNTVRLTGNDEFHLSRATEIRPRKVDPASVSNVNSAVVPTQHRSNKPTKGLALQYFPSPRQ